MFYQPFPSQQETYPTIQIQTADDESVSQPTLGYYQLPYGWTHSQVSPPSQGVFDPAVAYQPQGQPTASISHYPFLLQDPRGPIVLPPQLPTPSSPIPIPSRYDSTISIDSPPSPSPSTPGSTSSSASVSNPDICRQSEALFDLRTQRWYCGGCNRTFSDKYGVQRHIATIGVKVTCRYCGSRISALESSRRRHLGRESCRKSASDRGFTTRNEEDAFIADLPTPGGLFDNPSIY